MMNFGWANLGADAKPFRYVLPFAGRHFSQAYRKIALAEGYEAVRDRYPTLFAKLDGSNLVTADQLVRDYQTDHVVLEDDQAPEFQEFSNQHKMHYKIHAADGLARHGGEFDLFMRIRPDLSIKLRGFDWRDLLDVRRLPVRFGRLEEPSVLYSKTIIESLEVDSTGDQLDKTLLEAARLDESKSSR